MLNFSFYVDDMLWWTQICGGSIEKPIIQVIDPSTVHNQSLYICEEAGITVTSAHDWHIPEHCKVVVKWEPIESAPKYVPGPSNALELTGDYHADINTLTDRIAELESDLLEARNEQY